MSVSKEEFEKGIKPLDKGSLEYLILEFLKNKHAGYQLPEIKEGLRAKTGDIVSDLLTYFEFASALDHLQKNNKIISKEVKTDISGETKRYYMAK